MQLDEQIANIKGKHVCLLVCWLEEGRWYMVRKLRASGVRVTTLSPYCIKPGYPRVLSKISTRLALVYLPVLAFFLRKRFDCIVAWDMPTGATLGLLKRLLKNFCTFPPVAVQDFHINPKRMDSLTYQVKLRVLAAATAGMDIILTTSTREEKTYAQQFNLPAKKIQFFPDDPREELRDVTTQSTEDYVFAFGNSDRDFDVLVQAAKSFSMPVVILSQAYEPREALPENVRLIRDFIPETELYRHIAAARCSVLPLKDFEVAAGQNTMLEVMMLGRPLIVTQNVATLEYGTDGKNVLFVNPQNPDELAQKVTWVFANPEEANTIGALGKQSAIELLDVQAQYCISLVYNITHHSISKNTVKSSELQND